VIVIADTPQEAVRAGDDDLQPPCRAFLFTGWMLFPTPNQQCKSTEGNSNSNAGK